MIDDKDAIINAFRPIEQFFKIINAASAEVDDNVARTYAEVGLALCSSFRNIVEKVFGPEGKGASDEQ